MRIIYTARSANFWLRVSVFADKFPLPAQHPPRAFDQVEECELQRDGESQVRASANACFTSLQRGWTLPPSILHEDLRAVIHTVFPCTGLAKTFCPRVCESPALFCSKTLCQNSANIGSCVHVTSPFGQISLSLVRGVMSSCMRWWAQSVSWPGWPWYCCSGVGLAWQRGCSWRSDPDQVNPFMILFLFIQVQREAVIDTCTTEKSEKCSDFAIKFF